MAKTKVALIAPPYSQSYDKLITVEAKESRAVPPTGIMYLASYLEQGGIEARIYDGEIQGINPNSLTSWLSDFRPDIVGISSVVTDYHLARDIAEVAKETLGCLVVMGGHFPTEKSEFILGDTGSVDVIIKGEGEQALFRLAEIGNNPEQFQKIPNLAYRSDGKVKHNPLLPGISDLDSIPFPARHLVDVKKYLYPDPDRGMKQMSALFSSRGCPFSCTFCYKINGNIVRYRSVRNVVDELEEVVHKYGSEWVMFYDDTFTLNRKRAMGIATEIQNRGLGIRWKCQARTDTLDEELVDNMISAGLAMISLGIEGGNQQILDGVSKGINLERTRGICEMLSKKPLTIRASFILGLPGETYKSAQDTIEYAASLPIHLANFSILVPYPGTRVYTQAMNSEGISLIEPNWQHFRRHGYAVINTPTLGADDLLQLQEQALQRFYLHPHRIKHFIAKYRGGNHSDYYFRPLIQALRNV